MGRDDFRQRVLAWIVGAVAAVAAPSAAVAEAPVASCFGFDFSRSYTISGELSSDGHLAFVLAQDAPVYADRNGERVLRSADFSDIVYVKDPGRPDGRVDRMLVEVLSDPSVEGFMRPQDLHCTFKPLFDPVTKLERRAFVKPQIQAVSSEGGAQQHGVVVHRDPVRDTCTPGQRPACRELSRFEWYLVHDMAGDRYLLSEKFVLEQGDRLVGWVDKSDIIEWNTSAGIRPTVDIPPPPGSNEPEGWICGYRAAAEVGDPAKCRQILGGDRWFLSSVRMPVLAQEENGSLFRVAISSRGLREDAETEDRQSDPRNQPSMMGPGRDFSAAVAGVGEINHVDVFFVVDGTESMEPAIRALKQGAGSEGIVKRIQGALENRLRQGTRVRYGFLVYRDTQRDPSSGQVLATGIDESMALDDSPRCGQLSDRDVEVNHREFNRRFSQVTARPVPRVAGHPEDFDENTFGALLETGPLLLGCPNHLKIVFVIGDSGYDPLAQQRKGFPSVGKPQIARALSVESGFLIQPLTFFVRMPFNDQIPNIRDYRASFKQYRMDSLGLLEAMYARSPDGKTESSRVPGENFIPLERADITEEILSRIVESVRAYADPSIAPELASGLRGGESIVALIERLRGSHQDMPILFWDMVREGLCARLRDQCTSAIYEGVDQLLIQNDENVVPEIWMRVSELQDWIAFLRPLASMRPSGDRARELLRRVLVSSVETLVRVAQIETDESMQDFVQRTRGVPLRFHSPLMAYSPADFSAARSGGVIDGLEAQHILRWIRTSHQLLQIVEHGTDAPQVEFSDPPPIVRQRLSPNGLKVPYVQSAITDRPLGPSTEYSYMKSERGTIFYWVPQAFLP